MMFTVIRKADWSVRVYVNQKPQLISAPGDSSELVTHLVTRDSLEIPVLLRWLPGRCLSFLLALRTVFYFLTFLFITWLPAALKCCPLLPSSLFLRARAGLPSGLHTLMRTHKHTYDWRAGGDPASSWKTAAKAAQTHVPPVVVLYFSHSLNNYKMLYSY